MVSIKKDTKGGDRMEKEEDFFGKCPYVTSQKLISGKWFILIIHCLTSGVLRFGELQRKIPGITQATLTKQLRTLENYGLVKRCVYPEVPPKVEYSLTEMGVAFLPVLDQIKIWGDKYIDAVNAGTVKTQEQE